MTRPSRPPAPAQAPRPSRAASPAPAVRRSRVRALSLASAGIVLLAAAVFQPVLGYGFTLYDDGIYVTDNPEVRGGLTASGLRWAWTTGRASNWHPLTWMSHMLDWELYGAWAGGHHLTSLLLHLASALVLLHVLAAATGAPWRSAWVAAVFAVHPLHVESVAWVAERKDVLSALLGLLAIGAYVRYARAPSVGRYVPVALALALGLSAKPMLVTLPFVLLLLDLWPLGRWHGDAAGLGRFALEKLPLLPLVVASSAVTYLVQASGGAVRSFDRLPLDQRLGNAVVSAVAYLGQAVWPIGLAAHYPHPGASLAGWKVAACGAFLVAATVAALRVRERWPHVAVGWLWYLGMLVPVIGIVQVGIQARADRYTYLPLVGITLVLAWSVGVRQDGREGRRVASARVPVRLPVPLVAGIAAGSVLALAAAARAQVGHWRDSIALFEHAIAVTSDNDVAHSNLGLALYQAGRVEEAIQHAQEALRIRPAFPAALGNLGLALVEAGRGGEAVAPAERAVRLLPGDARLRNTLGMALAAAQRRDEAIAQYREAIRLAPADPKPHGNLGATLAAAGRRDEGVRELREALRLDPGFAEAHNNLGLALAAEGRVDEALAHFTAAVTAKPGYGRAHANRAGALYLEGDLAAARQAVAEARRYGVEPPPSLVQRLQER